MMNAPQAFDALRGRIWADAQAKVWGSHPLPPATLDEEWFDMEMESRACSRYAAKWSGHTMQIQFQVDGDSIFPSAAASIIAKWTREDLMDRLNGFWQSEVAVGTKSTAGYYVDAMRFAEEIEGTATKLGLRRDQWWRKK